jgi:prevent-host-death family protein
MVESIMKFTASKLRENIYAVLDQVLETGIPIEIERKGKLLRIVPVEPVSKLASLVRRPIVNGDPEALVHVDWSGAWKP